MATPKQIAANRRNAAKSTGPRSAASKEKVSQNRLTHGLCGGFRVLAHESQERFEEFIQRLTADQHPVGDLEHALVRKMAECMWMRQRAVDLANSHYDSTPLPHLGPQHIELRVDNNIEKMLRYEAHHDRVFRRALADLLKLQKERRLREIGFERQQREKAEGERREAREERRRKQDNIKFMTACVDFEARKDKLQAYRVEQILKTGQLPDGSPLEEAFECFQSAA